MEDTIYTFLSATAIGLLVGFIVSRILIAVLYNIFPDCKNSVKKRLSLLAALLFAAIFGYMGFMAGSSILNIDEEQYWFKTVQTICVVVLILLFSWSLIRILKLWEDIAFIHLQKKYPGSQKTKNIKTQTTILSRIFTPIIILLCILLSLWMVFPALKAFGGALVASAGIVSVVLGIAAQSTLSNIFSGIQIALTGSVRLDDYIKVGEDKGVVESITTIYVIIRLWDNRRILVPSNFFTTNIFENWSLEQDQMHATIDFDLDWNVPIQDLKQVLDAILKAEPLWDGRKGELIVSNATNGYVRVRAIVSTSTPQDALNIESSVREKIVQWIQNNSSTPGVRILPQKNETSKNATSSANKMKKI